MVYQSIFVPEMEFGQQFSCGMCISSGASRAHFQMWESHKVDHTRRTNGVLPKKQFHFLCAENKDCWSFINVSNDGLRIRSYLRHEFSRNTYTCHTRSLRCLYVHTVMHLAIRTSGPDESIFFPTVWVYGSMCHDRWICSQLLSLSSCTYFYPFCQGLGYGL